MRIRKRDGSWAEFDITRIQRGLLMAMQGGRTTVDVMPLVHAIVRIVGEGGTTQAIGDACENVLIDAGLGDVARRYMRYRLRREGERAAALVPDAGMLPDYIQIAKYAAHVNGERESYTETVDRVEGMMLRRFGDGLGLMLREAYDAARRRDVMGSMRAMQFAGPAIERQNARIYNCSFMHISRWGSFKEALYLLLCGCGVGYSVQWQHISQLSDVVGVGEGVVHWDVVDTIEGWADALGALIGSYTDGSGYVEFNYSLIRAKGTPLVTSGGRAPGHMGLKTALEAIRGVLDGCVGRGIRPYEGHSMLCHGALAVMSGGIRRASMLALFSVGDMEMMYCKTRGVFRPPSGEDVGLNSHLQMANNSAALLRDSVDEEAFRRLLRVAQQNYGCPSFFWTPDLDAGPNPCGEIAMLPTIDGEAGVSFCNLTEVNVATCADETDFLTRCVLAARIGTLQAAFTDFPYLGTVTKRIVERDALIGVGLCGIMDNTEVGLDATVLRRGAAAVMGENERVAGILGINTAARCCTVKPSGTSSLIMGVIGPGIHPRWARRYIRRVTAEPSEGPAQMWMEANPHMFERVADGSVRLLFPIQCSGVTVKEMTAIGFLEDVLTVMDNWIKPGTRRGKLTHNVSATVTVRDGELEDVLDKLWAERDRIAAISFAPYLLEERFRYAPQQAVLNETDEALWDHLIRLYKPIDWASYREEEDETTKEQTVACGPTGCSVL